MNWALISKMIGYACHSLTDDETVAIIDTPFTFSDGDAIPVYVELGAGFVRFFDDGDVFFHFIGRGMPIDEEGGAEFLSAIVKSNGLSMTETGEIEIEVAPGEAASGFARYMASMHAVVGWEKARDAACQASLRDEIPESAIK